MEKVLVNDMSKMFILLGGGAVSLASLWVRFITKIKGSFKGYLQATLIYILLSLLSFALIGVLAHPAVSLSPGALLVCYQFIFLALGCLHLYLMYRFLKWSGDEKTFWPELLFTAATGMLGTLLFAVVYRLLNTNGLENIMAGSIFFFIIPFFFYYAFQKALSISPKVRKQWIYPVHDTMEEPDESKLKNLVVISFEFEKQNEDAHVTSFRAKAPSDMSFSQLFYFFINDYNERHPEGGIQYVSQAGDAYGWVFYKKSKWYSMLTKYIDSDKTVFNNRIKENDVIICNRIYN